MSRHIAAYHCTELALNTRVLQCKQLLPHTVNEGTSNTAVETVVANRSAAQEAPVSAVRQEGAVPLTDNFGYFG